MKTRTVADLRAARESRANEALKMKDEQLRILQDQNNQLLRNLDRWVFAVLRDGEDGGTVLSMFACI